MISPMTVAAAGLTFFFNVRNFAAGGHLAIAADNASAGESREAEKPNETVHADLRCNRAAICMPLKFLAGPLSTAADIGGGAQTDRA
jgi:hypothetical protein